MLDDWEGLVSVCSLFSRFQCLAPSELSESSARYLTVFQENVETNNPILWYQGDLEKLIETLNQHVSGAVCQCHQTFQKLYAAETVNVIQYV